MSTWTQDEHEHARRQLAKHGRTWTILDEELSDEENEFVSEAPDLLHKALTEVERLRTEYGVPLGQSIWTGEPRKVDAFEQHTREEAHKRYAGDWDSVEQEPVDDWGYSEAQRQAFIAGAKWARECLRAENEEES